MILGLTLARGGSKGLPRKNIRMCAGKPLIAWTIEAARKANLLDNYLVSTEDVEIAMVAQQYGAMVVPRPEVLSSGEANRWDVLKYYVSQLPDVKAVVLLQATSPIRRDGLIDECISEFRTNGYDSLATGFQHHDAPYPDNRGLNRQELGPRFFDDGNIYIWSRECIETNAKQDAGKKFAMKVLSRQENIDINDEFDLWIAEKILEGFAHRI